MHRIAHGRENTNQDFLGSKLPKYGTKSVRSTLQPMPNGKPVNLLGTSKSSSVKSYIKNNGSDCSSSHSFNWRTANKYEFSAQSSEEPNNTQSSHAKVIDPEKLHLLKECLIKMG